MIAQLLRKWFGLNDPICLTCEVLRDQLDESNRERKELLTRLMERDKPEPLPSPSTVELQPIRPQHTPWRVRQQLLEQEDRRTAQLLRDKEKELKAVPTTVGAHLVTSSANITSLEEELGINTAGDLK